MMRALTFIYRPKYLRVLVYMLQNTEYRVGPYLKWFWRTQDFSSVMKRRQLDRTRAAILLLRALHIGVLLELVVGGTLIYLGATHVIAGGVLFGVALIVGYPVIWAHLIAIPLLAGREFSTRPQEQRLIQRAERIFAAHPGIKIAVAGSYGKTTMKELLTTVLGEVKKIAATPGNKNVSVSHARFAKTLQGDEDIVIIEYGEGRPGDVTTFARLTHPTDAVITGLAPAHLDQYKTLQAAGKDIFSVADYVKSGHVYVNDVSPNVKPFLRKEYQLFGSEGALGWRVKTVKVNLDGIDFQLTKGKRSIALHSGLVGRHQVGYLAFVAAKALELGLSEKQLVAAVKKTKPFEHRMQPYQLNGAWIVDDTYNGNLEGVRAGTELLGELKAKRKIYVTPGLVDQGEETERIHNEVGRLIASAQPDIVVLMRNSVTDYIRAGLSAAGFENEIRVEPDPLEFYTNLSHFIASGDLVLMQNDWTDNYA